MENDLHQAFYGVFCSSKEIIKNKQRHLYVNMLDLLGRTCKATGLAEGKIGIDNLVKFWLEDIMPLIFDADKTIQSCAVETLEQGINLMGISKIHQSKPWPELRTYMVTKLPEKIHELRSIKNKHWYQVWCLIIKILDREILNGASTINVFLSTVEMGFRSSDASVRAETFLCWRLLIKIFHSYNELLTPKRLKLICIPLKSTQSKSASLASVKIRVWWYFITCIGEKLGENFTKVCEPFLTYLFGDPAAAAAAASAEANREIVYDVKQYENIQMLAVLCLAQMLIDEQRDEFIEILLVENSLEMLQQPSPLLNLSTLKEHWQVITHSIISAVALFATANNKAAVNVDDESADGNRDAKQHLRNWLILRLVKIMLQLNYAPCTQEVCKALIDFLPMQTLPLNTALNCIASNNIVSDDADANATQWNVENFSAILTSIISLLIAGKSVISAGVLQRCIEQIGKIPQLFERPETQQQALCAIINVVCSSKAEDDFDTFEARLLCWKRVAQTVIVQLPDKNLSYRQKDFADVINGFILWPLQQLAAFLGNCQTAFFNDDFCAAWRQLLLCGQNAPNRERFLEDVEKTIRDLMTSPQKEFPLPELVNAYVTAMLKLDYGRGERGELTNILHCILSLLRDLIEQPKMTSTKSFEVYLNTLRNVYLHLTNQEVVENFELVKISIAHVANIVAKEKPPVPNVKIFNEWKQGVLDRFRSIPQRNYATQIREVFKNDDLFVIIPTVWMLNPEKLTERQKERFAERSDIPALYNDMSQSQDDSSIKPWTPNKIVIAKKDQTEIVIGPSQPIAGAGEGGKNDASSSSSIAVEERPKRRRAIKSIDYGKAADDDDATAGAKTKNNNKNSGNENNEDSKSTTSSKNNTDFIPTEPITNCIRTRKSLRNYKQDVAEQNAESQATQVRAAAAADVKSPTKSKTSEPTSSSVQKKSPESSECLLEKICPPPAIIQQNLCEMDTQQNSETQIFSLEKITATDETIPETQTQSMDLNTRELEPLIRTDSLEMNLEPKELSPKKQQQNTTKIVVLSSPPDRKSTNNSCSPSLRPKPTPHLTRGAQFINMIRSKMSPAATPTSIRSSFHLNKSSDRRESTPVPENVLEPPSIVIENTSTPIQKKDLLTFTKRLPSPSASPSASILKRKLRRDSFDDISATESPATKRKRVSFHDPPVSVTKEYVRDVEENLIKPKRCLTLEKPNAAAAGGGNSSETIKHALKRRNKLDSMTELDTFNNETSSEKLQLSADRSCNSSTSSARKIVLNFEEENNSELPPPPPPSVPAPPIEEEVGGQQQQQNLPAQEDAQMPDAETALNVVLEELSLETILERYLSSEKTATVKAKQADTLAKFISKCMTTNAKVKASVLEILSENHSKDFLDHAVQENLSSVVCDRLNLDSVIDYICAKSKLNTSCRQNLLAKIPEVLKHSKVEKEPLNFIGTLVQSLNPTDATILEIIDNLMRIRHERQSSSTPEMESTDVSSSNL